MNMYTKLGTNSIYRSFTDGILFSQSLRKQTTVRILDRALICLSGKFVKISHRRKIFFSLSIRIEDLELFGRGVNR